VTVPPIVDAATLAAFLGGTPNAELVALCAAAASEAVAVVVDPPPVDADPAWSWPSGVTLVGVGVGADAYKAMSAPGAGYQLDEATYTDAFRVVSTLLRRYEPFYNGSRAIGGMIA
jgi:hypothetical protein